MAFVVYMCAVWLETAASVVISFTVTFLGSGVCYSGVAKLKLFYVFFRCSELVKCNFHWVNVI